VAVPSEDHSEVTGYPDAVRIATETLHEEIVAAAPMEFSKYPYGGPLTAVLRWVSDLWRLRGVGHLPHPAFVVITPTRLVLFRYRFKTGTALAGPVAAWPLAEVRASPDRWPGSDPFTIRVRLRPDRRPIEAVGFTHDEAASKLISLLTDGAQR